jgi:hypothetical protein
MTVQSTPVRARIQITYKGNHSRCTISNARLDAASDNLEMVGMALAFLQTSLADEMFYIVESELEAA